MNHEQKNESAIGIDLGTTYSVIAYLNQDGNPKTILNEEGDLTTPSTVFFDRDGTIVGREAVRAGHLETERLASFAKRDIGEDCFHKKILGHSFPPEVIEALVLKKLKKDAELQLGSIQRAVITVPAYFNEPRRKATQDAGKLAGLEVLDIINEPTAAAIAYGFQNGFILPDTTAKEPETILVYDLGGGTFDVTVMEIDGRNYNTLATGGDVHLGGIDWDERVVKFLAEAFQKEHGYDLLFNEQMRENLLFEASEAKRSLTARNQAKVQITHEGRQCRVTLSRLQFESLTADLLERTRLTVRRVLKEANTPWEKITRLLLVGGSTRMPMVQKMLQQESGKQVDRSLSPDEAVAHGAAIYAGTFVNQPADSTHRVSIANVNSHDLGVLGLSKSGEQLRKLMIARNTSLPASRVSRFVTAKDSQKNISIRVIEGGTDTGEGANEIGKCIVQDLPQGLPAGTKIEVTFHYQADGRFVVSATVPDVGAEAEMTIQRSSGFTEEMIKTWAERIAEDIKVEEEAAETTDELEVDDEEGFVLEDDEDDEEEDAEASFLTDDDEEPAEQAEEPIDSLFEGLIEEGATKKVKTDDSGLDDFLKGLK
jgi:molecular chaperone DnaK